MATSLKAGLEQDLAGLFLLNEQGEPGDAGGGGGDGDCSGAGSGLVCSKPKDAINSTKDGRADILPGKKKECEALKERTWGKGASNLVDKS